MQAQKTGSRINTGFPLFLPYSNSIKAAGDNPNDATQEAIANIAEAKEKVELELQKNQMLLDTSTGIKVKINSGYSIG